MCAFIQTHTHKTFGSASLQIKIFSHLTSQVATLLLILLMNDLAHALGGQRSNKLVSINPYYPLFILINWFLS